MNIEEERQACTDSIVYGLTKTSEFRARKAKEYPQDLRNVRAVETLKQLAKNAAELSADFWEMLRHHYNPDSKEWQPTIKISTLCADPDADAVLRTRGDGSDIGRSRASLNSLTITMVPSTYRCRMVVSAKGYGGVSRSRPHHCGSTGLVPRDG
jgi:hypothetical protein